MKKVSTLWGSRFNMPADKVAIEFAAGRDVTFIKPADENLLPYDIWLNKAHCVMLTKQNIISKTDAKIILQGLSEIELLTNQNSFPLDPDKEDVHSNIESWLIEKYGIESSGRLHTARSRNDQVVTDERLYLRDKTLFFIEEIIELSEKLNNKAYEYKDYVMPGFTHHQHAMITSFGHIISGFVAMLNRDITKLKSVYEIINTNPLGSTASFGTSFTIDRDITSRLLGFTAPDDNSLDGITNRAEPGTDLAYCLSSFMNHLSILAETLITFSMPQFSFITVSDHYSTGSSIMPQKRNPDMLEVIKGKASYVHGALSGLLSAGKGAFIGYNRDSQWSKYIIIDVVDACTLAPRVMMGIIDELTVHKDSMAQWAHKSFIGATSFLELLCQNHNLPFRKGKIIVEKAIKYSKDKNKIDNDGLNQSLTEEMVDIKIDEETLVKWQDPTEILNLYASYGSPSIKSMSAVFEKNKEKIANNRKWLDSHKKILTDTVEILSKEIELIMK